MGSKERRRGDLSQFGLFDIGGDDEDEGSLMKELDSLMGGGTKKAASKSKAKKPIVPPEDFDAMLNACLADCPQDVELDMDGDDADLLDELNDIVSDEEQEEIPSLPSRTQPKNDNDDSVYENSNLLSVVETRISMYASAKESALSAGDSSHARRYGRALDQLKDHRRRIQLGKPVNEDDLPSALSEKQIMTKRDERPPLPIPPSPPVESIIPSSPAVKPPDENAHEEAVLSELRLRRETYKQEALAAKERGDKAAAIQGLKGVKAMDELIKNHDKKEVSPPSQQPLEGGGGLDKNKPITLPSNMDDVPSPDPSIFGGPPPPKSVIEALYQRLEYYTKEEVKAKESGNDSKGRRIGRICKQYKDAIKATKAGKPIDDESLPAPLGYAPIPVRSAAPQPTPTSVAAPPKASPFPPSTLGGHSVQGKQLKTLLERQSLFKAAALEAKKSGQINQAKEYLRQFHGFDNLIEASRGGLPVDLNSTPVPPQLIPASTSSSSMMDFVVVSRQDSLDEGKSRQEMFQKLEEELLGQIKMCESNRAYFKSTGDIPSSNKFHQMEVHTKKDLSALQHAYKRNGPVPIFHYEVRSFSKVVCNTDLTDNEVEVSIIEGSNFKGEKSMDTYICYEFPYPKEEPTKGETSKVKDSLSPKFEHKSSIPINIKEKSCQRVFKRHSLKCEVWIDRGFFRKDVLLGTATAKLTPLETQCTLHDCFPLMDGRKAVGGTLEIQVRLRNPVLTRQVEKAQEKWLVISF